MIPFDKLEQKYLRAVKEIKLKLQKTGEKKNEQLTAEPSTGCLKLP